MQLVAAGKEAKLVYQTDPQAPGMLLGFAPIGDTGWYVVVEEPWDNIAGEVARYRWALAGLGGMAVLLVAGLLIGATRRVVRPLDALVTEGQRVLAGRKFRPLAVEGPADVRALLQVVNGMVARLDEQQATLRHYALQVLRGQEEERLRLSRDLHDETVQDLVALSQRLDLLRSRNQLDAEAAAELARFQAMLHSAIGEVRRLSNNLRPHVLEDLGLPAALRAIARDLETQLEGTQVHCEVVGRERALPSELELTVFRIAQEAFANIRKHASTATHVSVALIYEPDRVQLVVEDDGPGFQVGADSHLGDGHLGLTGMQERAQLFGGRLQVTSAPGQGTTVLLTLPQAGASPD
jgi:signal transduction histidine kinase